MIQYEIYTTEWSPSWPSKVYMAIDYVSIEGYIEEIFLNEELNNFSSEYIREVVLGLQQVIKWKQEYYSFWYETTIITVAKKWFVSPVDNRKHVNGLVGINYNYWKNFLESSIEIEELLKMMIDYRDHVDAWEKETGKIK